MNDIPYISKIVPLSDNKTCFDENSVSVSKGASAKMFAAVFKVLDFFLRQIS